MIVEEEDDLLWLGITTYLYSVWKLDVFANSVVAKKSTDTYFLVVWNNYVYFAHHRRERVYQKHSSLMYLFNIQYSHIYYINARGNL